MIPWLAPDQPFPPVSSALDTPNGLLAASGDLTAQRLLSAYRAGIFPWSSQEEPVLWWSPDPRMVLYTDEVRISRSFAKTLRRAARDASIQIRLDSDFEAVMHACAGPRNNDGDGGTWITDAVISAYVQLHRRGLAHSVETWVDGRLVGGLYGVSLGRMFYGESMFAHATDASKIALAALVQLLRNQQVRVIDCQQNTRHLASLGAREISRQDFVAHVATSVHAPSLDWPSYREHPLNALLCECSRS